MVVQRRLAATEQPGAFWGAHKVGIFTLSRVSGWWVA